jgi:peroxiredoxin
MRRVLLLLLMLPIAAFTQQKFALKGSLRPTSVPTKAFLYYTINGQTKIDSVNISEGAFTFNGTLTEVAQAHLKIKRYPGEGALAKWTPSDLLDFYLEPGTTVVVSKTDSIGKAVINGSVINDDVAKCKALAGQINSRAGEIMTEYKSGTREQQKDSIYIADFNARLKALDDEVKKVHPNFMRNNTDAYYSLILYKNQVNVAADTAYAAREFARFSPRLKSSPLGLRIWAEINSARVLAVGQPAPAFTQNDINGKPVHLADFKGKYVLIDFWASWCGPCRQENPNVVKVYEKFKGKNFTVLGVSLDNAGQKAAWLQAIKDDGLSWTQVSDLKGAGNEAALLYNVKTIPGNFLVGPDGKILAKNLRGSELENKIAELLDDKNSR